MIYQKSLQQVIVAIVIIALTGCTVPATPLEAPTATRMQAVITSSTPTLVQISSFEECVARGNPIQSTYPRQCISDNGEIFQEPLDNGVIFGKTYGGKGRDIAYSITSTKDGGHLITGVANDYQCLILKLDASSQKEWEYALGQELREELQFVNAWFHCDSAKQTSDGAYAVMGTGLNGSTHKRFIMQFDRDGKWISVETLVEREGKIAYLDAEGNLTWLNSFGLSRKVIETSDSGYAIAGMFPHGSPDSSTHIIKADVNGDFVWEKNLCLDNKIRQAWEEEIVCLWSNLWDAIQSQDGGYVMTGGTGKLGQGIWLVKTDSDGNVEWIQSYIREFVSLGHSLIQTPDGGFLIAGSQLIDQRYQDGILIKTDSAGNLQWSRIFGGSQHDSLMAIDQGLNGEIFVIGDTGSFGEGAEDIWLLGIDSTILK